MYSVLRRLYAAGPQGGQITDGKVNRRYEPPLAGNSTYLERQRCPLRLVIHIVLHHLDHVDELDVPFSWRI